MLAFSERGLGAAFAFGWEELAALARFGEVLEVVLLDEDWLRRGRLLARLEVWLRLLRVLTVDKGAPRLQHEAPDENQAKEMLPAGCQIVTERTRRQDSASFSITTSPSTV